MKRNMHTFLSWFFIWLLILSSALPNRFAYADENISLTLTYDGQTRDYSAKPVNLVINGDKVTDLEMPPIIFDDYTLVPARAVLELMGANVSWNSETSNVIVTMGKKIVVFHINDTVAIVNGTPVNMGIPPKVINEKTMVPLRFVADYLDFLVYWDEQTRTIYIDNIVGEQTPDVTDEAAPEANPANPADDDTELTNAAHSQTINLDEDDEVSITRNVSQTPVIPAVDKSVTEIKEMNYPEARITALEEPHSSSNFFAITASEPISKVEKHLLNDNRMYLDIYAAVADVPQSLYSYTDNPSVAMVRVAQNQTEPENVVRVVFYLKDGTEYFVGISEDRTTLTVGFSRNAIHDVGLVTESGRDIITITGQTTPNINIYPADGEDLIIDIPYADIEKIEKQTAGEFVKSISAIQYNANTARITLDLNKKAGYALSVAEDSAVITLYSPTQKNIEYDFENMRIVLGKTPGVNIDISSFIHKDNYSVFRYIITLPGDYSEYFGQGEHIINDAYLNAVAVRTENGQTSIIIDETRILAYKVYEDSANIYIQPVLPKEKYDRIVVIDAGHGGHDAGAKGNGVIESELNLDIILRLNELLERDSRIKVYATRLTDVYPSLTERVRFANELGDLFVSVHNNYAGGGYGAAATGIVNRNATGTETYFYPHANDDTIGIASERVAEIMQNRLISVLGSVDRGVKTNDYQVIVSTKIPAVLCEIGFISSPTEAAMLASSEYKTMAALALYAGIMDVFEQGGYKPPR